MTVRSVHQTGYTGTETSVVMHGRQLPGGTPVVFCHGFGVGAQQSFNSEGEVQRQLADRYEVTSGGADLGGISTWGNDDSIDAVDALVTFMGSGYGCRTDRVAVYGTSMGGATALNWAMRNPSKVVALAMTAPVVALEAIRDQDPLGLGNAIEDAYGGEAGFEAALPTHDPSHVANREVVRVLGPRTRIWYSTDDNVISAADVVAYAGFSGCILDSMGAIGHSASAGALSAVAEWLDRFCA